LRSPRLEFRLQAAPVSESSWPRRRGTPNETPARPHSVSLLFLGRRFSACGNSYFHKRALAGGGNHWFAGAVSEPYEEILDGASLPRSAPDARHELICSRLHDAMAASVGNLAATQLLAPRTRVRISHSTTLCPDLALLAAPSGKLVLAVEIISREDHRADTVMKKEIYEHIRVPRLWMVDPRYDNVEVYHCTQFGLQLQGILAGKQVLGEKLIPEFQIVIAELFAAAPKA